MNPTGYIVRPTDGGALITNLSSEVGIDNYTEKVDFRRKEQDREARREGCDYFAGNLNKAYGNQPFPNYPNTDEEITLIGEAVRPNGKRAPICGTATKLWRYFSLEEADYVLGDENGIYVLGDANGPYFQDDPGDWVLIGSGFATEAEGAHRWEVVTINGSTIFNNGVDLLQEYRLEWLEVRPLYELRELGVVSVGTIAEYSTFLMLADITEFATPEDLASFMQLEDSGAVTAAQGGGLFSGIATGSVDAGNFFLSVSTPYLGPADEGATIYFPDGFSAVITVLDSQHATLSESPTTAIAGRPFWIARSDANVVTASADFFRPEHVGRKIVWDSSVERTILSYISPTQVTVGTDWGVASGPFGISNPNAYGRVTGSSTVRVHYRTMWSLPNLPTRFGPLGIGSISAGSALLVLKYPMLSLESGMELIILGAGDAGGNLQAKITFITGGGLLVGLDTTAATTAIDTDFTATDAGEGTVLGSQDLAEDSTGILRMLELQGVLVVYKALSIFLGRYTGIVSDPFQYKHLNIPSKIRLLHYPWTLITIDDLFHFYAGATNFYRFDLTSQVPDLMAPMEAVNNLFFDQARLADKQRIWAADNALTQEIFIGLPGAPLLCIDHKFQTVSTSTMRITAAATIRRPEYQPILKETEDWFVMGNDEGTILLYGLVTEEFAPWAGKTAFFRRSVYPLDLEKQPYQSRLKSALDQFRDPASEKMMDQYVLWLASQMQLLGTGVNLTVNLYGARNTAEGEQLLTTAIIGRPEAENMIPVYFLANYFSDEIIVDGTDNPCEIVARGFWVRPINSRNYVRRPT